MMTRFSLMFAALLFVVACQNKSLQKPMESNPQLAALLDNYYKERMQLFPLESTQNGMTEYNDKMYADFTDSYREKIKAFYQRTLNALSKFNKQKLNENDRISYDFMQEYTTDMLNDLQYTANYIPTDQMWGRHLYIGQWATGTGAQPFKTVEDYDKWRGRVQGFITWMDSAIVYFRKGIAANYTLPKPLVSSMIPEFEYMVTKDAQSNLFYEPVKNLPTTFSSSDKERITKQYTSMITDSIIPAYARMTTFLKNEYLPAARSTTNGLSALPHGIDRYKELVRFQTTTNKTPDEIRQIGFKEVARIRGEMEKIKNEIGFTGTLNDLFNYMRTDPRFRPFKTPEEVLDAFRAIQNKITPNLPRYFTKFPKTPFEIRRTEAFRENSASAEYIQSPDGVKPGIFYVPIPDAKKFAVTSGMESLFLHEAIPGHHYQISLQIENQDLPKIRRYNELNNAYVEGWALYCEGLGKDLGLYTDPYQHLGALGDEIHRAIRLVVDVSLHTSGMSREDAIKYMMENEAIDEQGATAEIERYISGPAQALGYKIGALKILELRNKYKEMLGNKFSLPEFHYQLLKDGAMPLTVLESKMDRWAQSVK